MTWADVFIALDALFVFPVLLAGLALAWKAAASAETIVQSDWPKLFEGRFHSAAPKKIGAAASRHCH